MREPSAQLHQIAATYSIAAMDMNSGEMGGAVQSHFFSVGPAVLWAEAGAGVVITQSVVNRQYGPEGLSLLKSGRNADAVLKELVGSDSGKAYRQAAILDCLGNTAAHTGSSCIREAGHANGLYYSVQANMMLNDTVWSAMESAFLHAQGTLGERMTAALCAAEQEGGDIRGRQSAALKVVKTEASGDVSSDVVLDLRVEDNPEPLEELSRLLSLSKGYQMLELGDEAMEQGNADNAARYYQQANELLGENPEALYWHGIALLNAGNTSEGMDILRPLFSSSPNWVELTLRLPESGLASFNAAVLDELRNRR